jgi:hypothetical protein
LVSKIINKKKKGSDRKIKIKREEDSTFIWQGEKWGCTKYRDKYRNSQKVAKKGDFINQLASHAFFSQILSVGYQI